MPEIKISNNELIKPLLSVCIITYNHKDYISKAIESVLVQKTDFPFEIIIADDCSTDGTRELLLEYQNKYPGLIKLILQEKNVGIHQNWIDLLYAPETKYIAYFDGDDYWIDEDKLQVQVDYLEANDQCSGVFHESKILVEGQGFSERIFGSDTQDEINAEDTISKGALFHSSSFVFRRSSLVLPEWIKSVASGDMALYSIVAASGFLKKIPKVMSVYRKHSGGITENDFIKNSYHENRISLTNYLNEFHQFKYVKKVKKVTEFHLNEIAGKKVQDKMNILQKIKLKILAGIRELKDV